MAVRIWIVATNYSRRGRHVDPDAGAGGLCAGETAAAITCASAALAHAGIPMRDLVAGASVVRLTSFAYADCAIDIFKYCFRVSNNLGISQNFLTIS